MACRSCKRPLELLPRRATLCLPESGGPRAFRGPCRGAASTPVRGLHTTPVRFDEPDGLKGKLQRWFVRPVAERMQTTARKTTHSYMVYGATEHIYKTFSAQANYRITPEDRRNGTFQQLADGEEVGVGGGMWHDDFQLPPTFSTWSHVTMLHMYLLVVRLRCLDRDAHQLWQSQLVDHFFHDAEGRMEMTHELGSRAVRQRYLKDLFVQWRGLMLAYDEGFVRGDAVLASAVWRNLFKAREDADLRVLAAIVSWMRLSLRNLDQMADDAIVTGAANAFKWPAKAELALVDVPAREMSGVYKGTAPATASATARAGRGRAWPDACSGSGSEGTGRLLGCGPV